MRKKVFTAILSLGLVTSMNVTVLADTLEELLNEKSGWEQKIEDANKNINDLANAKSDAEEDIEELTIAIQQLDSKIETLMIDIEKNKKDLTVCKENIVKSEKDVSAAEEVLKEQQELLDSRMRAMYKTGSGGYIGIILKSKGFSDLVSRIEAVNKMTAFDKQVIEELDEKKKDLQEKKKLLEDEKIRIEKIKIENEAKKASLDQSKKEQNTLRQNSQKSKDKFDSTISSLYKKIEVYNDEIDEIDEKIEGISGNTGNNGDTPSRGDDSYSNDEVVQYAMKFRGIPYKWGGNTPKEGFDCSGFVRYVYAHFGVYLPRTSYTQINVGTPIARSNLQPGDLVFFGYGTPHHVGMYIGNNCYIHAPQTGDVVKISPLTRKDYLGARRVK